MLPGGNTAALAAQLAAGGDSAMRLQQILANLPMVGIFHKSHIPSSSLFALGTISVSMLGTGSLAAHNMHTHIKLHTYREM